MPESAARELRRLRDPVTRAVQAFKAVLSDPDCSEQQYLAALGEVGRRGLQRAEQFCAAHPEARTSLVCILACDLCALVAQHRPQSHAHCLQYLWGAAADSGWYADSPPVEEKTFTEAERQEVATPQVTAACAYRPSDSL